MSGSLDFRIVDKLRLDVLRPDLERARTLGEVTPLLRAEISATIEQLEREPGQNEYAIAERLRHLRELRSTLKRLDGPHKPRHVDVIYEITTVRCFVEYDRYSFGSSDTPRTVVTLADRDDELYWVLIRELNWFEELITAWPEPLFCHGEGEPAAVISFDDLARLDRDLTELARRPDWMERHATIFEPEHAEWSFRNFRQLVVKARAHPGWTLAVDRG